MEPRKHVEQIEVIEHHIIEGRRPVSRSELANYQPESRIRQTSESYITSGPGPGEPLSARDDSRFYLTGERDASRDASFFTTGPIEGPPLQHSTPERSHSGSGVNNYGYDLHEVHTSEGGARVVQTHGSGHILSPTLLHESSLTAHDRSMETVIHSRSGVPTAAFHGSSNGAGFDSSARSPQADLNVSQTSERLHGILKTSDSWKRFPSPDDTSLTRKDSYKRMQETHENTSAYAPSSATMVSRGSEKRWVLGSQKSEKEGFSQKLRNLGQLARRSFSQLDERLRSTQWTPRLIGTIALLIVFLIFVLLLFWLVFGALFSTYSVREFLLFPPVCDECLKKNPAYSADRPPSKVYVHFSSPAQVHFELIGNPPFKSNSFTAVDFETGYIAIADHALTDQNGKHTTCFLMQLDLSALPSMAILGDALGNTDYEVHSQFGWQEYWQYAVEPIDRSQVAGKFKDEIRDCRDVKWYFLKHTVYTRDESCSDCYDFCLPDYAVQRKQKYEDDVTLSIRRLNCFRLYVPEWSRFQVRSDPSGGHWQYPLAPQNTQRDSSGNWVNWSPSSFSQPFKH